MKDYKINGKVYEITLETGKIVKVDKDWVEKSIKALDTDLEDVLLMYLEDEGYLVNEEQQELIEKTKDCKFKVVATDVTKRKTQKERVQKENPTKELIIQTITNALHNLGDISNLKVENKAKIITFELNNEQFKVDLVQKRKPKAQK